MIICSQCGGENRPGTGRCIHCAHLFGSENEKSRHSAKTIRQELDEMRDENERRAKMAKMEAAVQIEADSLRGKVLPGEPEPEVELMEPVPFAWQKYLFYVVAAIVIVALGLFAYRTMFPTPETYGTLNNFTERSGSPLFKQVLGVSSKPDYERAMESVVDNHELFESMIANGSAILIPNGTHARVVEASAPFTMVEVEGRSWYVLSDYVSTLKGAGVEPDYLNEDGGESASEDGY
jgi:hypothetical protein